MENSQPKISRHGGRSYKEQLHPIWDCGSSLYDSFELNSLKRQLDSAMASSSHRTMPMPHLPDGRGPLDTKIRPQTQPGMSYKPKKSIFKFPRSLQRFLRSIFKPSRSNPVFVQMKALKDRESNLKDGFYVVNNRASMLWTIPELDAAAAEQSPEFSSSVRRSASERFHHGRKPHV